MCVCVCVRVCVRACVRACVCAVSQAGVQIFRGQRFLTFALCSCAANMADIYQHSYMKNPDVSCVFFCVRDTLKCERFGL